MRSTSSANAMPGRANKADGGDLTGKTGPKQMWERACPAMRRAGGARSQERCKNTGRHLVALTRYPDMHTQATAQLCLSKSSGVASRYLSWDRMTATRC